MSAQTLDLAAIGAGFADPVYDSQAAFRDALAALSRPGRLVETVACGDAPGGVHPAAQALLLALLDQDTSLWLSPALAAGDAPGYYRFHTGCRVTDARAAADFALIANVSELPALDGFNPGSAEYPERSATVVVQVDAIEASGGWRLAGPGIRDGARLAAAGLGADFAAQWARNAKLFPLGVDIFLASGRMLCGLPRSTRLED